MYNFHDDFATVSLYLTVLLETYKKAILEDSWLNFETMFRLYNIFFFLLVIFMICKNIFLAFKYHNFNLKENIKKINTF